MKIDVYTFIKDQINNECALIICAPTGIFYDAQCGGISCTHPEAEGFFLPMWDFCPDLDDCEYGCEHLTKCRNGKHDRPDLRDALATAIEMNCKIFNDKSYTFKIKFDRERIDELQEGWWPMIIDGSIHDVTMKNQRCYFHKGNCD